MPNTKECTLMALNLIDAIRGTRTQKELDDMIGRLWDVSPAVPTVLQNQIEEQRQSLAV